MPLDFGNREMKNGIVQGVLHQEFGDDVLVRPGDLMARRSYALSAFDDSVLTAMTNSEPGSIGKVT
jgi:hypothetical protein